jgi:hypothetical protein
MEKKLRFGVRVWSVVMCLVAGWKTAKAEVIRSACEELILAGDGERVILLNISQGGK